MVSRQKFRQSPGALSPAANQRERAVTRSCESGTEGPVPPPGTRLRHLVVLPPFGPGDELGVDFDILDINDISLAFFSKKMYKIRDLA